MGENRRPRVLEVIAGWRADLFSLVECDDYESFFKPELAKLGYESAYKQRPRPGSDDGCVIFWRRGAFELVAEQGLR